MYIKITQYIVSAHLVVFLLVSNFAAPRDKHIYTSYMGESKKFFDSYPINKGSEQFHKLNISERTTAYKFKVSLFGNFFLLQLSMIAVCIAIRNNISESIQIPVLGVSVPTFWIKQFAALLGIYFTLQFGFLVDNIIGQRVILADYLDRFQAYSNSSQLENVTNNVYNYKGILDDSSFIDAWVVLFVNSDIVSIYDRSPADNVFVYFGLMIYMFVPSVASGLSICLAAQNAQSKYTHGRDSKIWCVILTVYVVMYITSAYTFKFSGGNQNTIQYYMIIVTIFTLYFYGLKTKHDSSSNV